MISDEILSIVFDIGSLNLRCGFSGDDAPRYQSTTKMGTYSQIKNSQDMQEEEIKQLYGDEKLINPIPTLEINDTIHNGKIKSFDYYSGLINHSYERLKVKPKEYSMLLANNFETKEDRNKVAEILFEEFQIPNLFFVRNSVLSSFSGGRQTSLVIDIGAYQTTISAVYEGYALLKTVKTQPIGGETLNQFILQSYQEQFQSDPLPQFKVKKTMDDQNNPTYSINDTLKTTQSFYDFKLNELLRDIKESQLQYVDPISTQQLVHQKYQLPDGKTFFLEKNDMGEQLFGQNQDYKGLQHQTMEVMNASNPDLKSHLAGNIIVTGGCSAAPGLVQKLNISLQPLVPQICKIKMIQYPSAINRINSVFLGGSILGSLSSFQSMWISHKEFKEDCNIIDRKCPM